MNIMPFLIVGFHRKEAVIYLTGGGDWGHGGIMVMDQGVTPARLIILNGF
jgi:hypothetical protein